MSAMQDQWLAKPTTASAVALNQIAVAGIVALLGVSYMFNAMDRQVFPALLRKHPDYGLTLPEAGFVSTVFTVNVAIFAALSGWFMARFGRRYVLLGGLVCYSLFTLLTPLATGFVSLTFLRALTGVGEALQVGAVFACMGAYFGARRGAAMGAMQTFFGLGAFLGPVSARGWKAGQFLVGVVLRVRGGRDRHGHRRRDGHSIGVHRRRSGPSLVRNTEKPTASIWTRKLILSAVSFGLVGFSFFSYSALYANYAHTVLGFSVVDAGAALGMYGIGAMLGVFGGWLGDKISNRSIVGGLLLMATAGYVLFDGGRRNSDFTCCCRWSSGLTMSGFLFTRFMSVVQRSVDPSRIGYAGPSPLAASTCRDHSPAGSSASSWKPLAGALPRVWSAAVARPPVARGHSIREDAGRLVSPRSHSPIPDNPFNWRCKNADDRFAQTPARIGHRRFDGRPVRNCLAAARGWHTEVYERTPSSCSAEAPA